MFWRKNYDVYINVLTKINTREYYTRHPHATMSYDYVIVGAGPAGLTLAWLLSRHGNRCAIIEREKQIGGCHSVRRGPNGEFAEHGPRVYSSTYTTLARLVRDMGSDFDKLFTPYKFAVSTIGNKTVSNMAWWEVLRIASAYIQCIFMPAGYKAQSMRDFTRDFTPGTIDYIDRVCRLTDGAGLDNYSAYKFLQIINQNGLYQFYQPREPNDKGIFALFERELSRHGVDIFLGESAEEILTDVGISADVGITTANTDVGINTASTVNTHPKVVGLKTSSRTLKSPCVILAIPPPAIGKIVGAGKDHRDLFAPESGNKLAEWISANTYNDYITITYQWNSDIQITSVWGFPETEWGVASVVLSDYFSDAGQKSGDKTIISAGITRVDTTCNGKTARECSDDELIAETFRQLRVVYPNLPKYDSAIIGSRIGGDSAYIQGATDPSYLPAQSRVVNGLYNLGTQNGKSQYSFTSMETAVVNATALAHELEPETRVHPIVHAWTVNYLIAVIVIVIVCIIAVWVWVRPGAERIQVHTLHT
jgi:NAD(P)-binding Rossmann-like domain